MRSSASLAASGAEQFNVFPLGPALDAPGGADSLAVAAVDPLDGDALARLAEDSGRAIVAHAAPELRIFYYLEKHYGLSRKARFIRTGSNESVPEETPERRRTQPPRGIAVPPVIRLEPRGRGSRTTRPSRAATPRPGISYREACSAIDVAESREAIADVFVEFADGRFEVAVVFLVRDANAIGWRMHTAPGTLPMLTTGPLGSRPDALPGTLSESIPRALEALSLPLGGASALQEAHDSGVTYRGGPTSAGKPTERALWQFLGLEQRTPVEMLVVPIMVRRRVVNLVYAHGLGHGPVDDTSTKKLGELARRAARAYARLIQAAKNSESDD